MAIFEVYHRSLRYAAFLAKIEMGGVSGEWQNSPNLPKHATIPAGYGNGRSYSFEVRVGRIFVSLVVFFIVAGGVLVYQATRGTSSLVLMPSELLAKAHASNLPRVRVGGRVVDPVEYQTEPFFLLRFSVRDPKGGDQIVPVEYRGLKPDMFQAGRDVLIDGDFKGGTLVAAKLQTQCPSKYEPAMPGVVSTSRVEDTK